MGSSMITAIAAGIVSLSALGVSIYEAYLMREQQAASVLPIVDFWAGYELGGAYALNLANKGLGPGFIKDIEVSVDQGSHDNWGQVMAAVNGKRVPRTESALIGSVLAPGDIATLVSIQDPTLAGEVWGEASRISLSVCF